MATDGRRMPNGDSAPENGSVARRSEASSSIQQIDVEMKWVTYITTKLNEYTSSQTAEIETNSTSSQTAEIETNSIPRVPKGPRGFDQGVEKAFEPRVISIGPYHRGKPHLTNMEKHKWQCLKDIDDHRLNDLFEALERDENRARSFYSERKQGPNRWEFLEMLLLDGCFIVDYLDRASSDESRTKIWSDHQIRNDLLLLENQLPFFVVERIYHKVKNTSNNRILVESAVKLFNKISPKEKTPEDLGVHNLGVHDPERGNFKHLLHLYHAYLFFDVGKKKTPGVCTIKVRTGASPMRPEEGTSQVRSEEGASQVRTIPSAILLQEAGIKFKKRKKIDRVINVTFDADAGVIEMTDLVIDAFTISQYLNLIEFERAHPDMEPRVTAFLQFMDCIINTAEDVALLRKNDVLDHAFGSDEEVAGIFNRLTSGTFHQLSLEMKRVYRRTNEHCKNNWNRWWATLLRDHFGSPWAAIGILVAVLLLCFDFIQTFVAVYSYFRPSSAS